MENSTDALKMAFAVIVFVMALTIAVMMFSQLNQVSKLVVSSSDITKYYEYKPAENEEQTRIVGLETIIPTLYTYYKENYTVLFLNKNGAPLELYESQTNRALWSTTGIGTIGKYYTTDESQYATYDQKSVCAFDVDEETIRHEPWTGSLSDYKENLDAFLYGGTFKYKSGAIDSSGKRRAYKYSNFIDTYKKSKFKETLGEYKYNLTTEEEDNSNVSLLLKNRKKRVIIYQLQE